MRSIRALLPLVAIILIAPIASAQSSMGGQSQTHARGDFENSWFWGAYGGLYGNSTAKEGNFTAPDVGADWLITHKWAGLYLSVDQAFFKNKSGYFVVEDTAKSGILDSATFKDMRRFTAQFFVFPKAFGAIHPYAGIGAVASLIRQTQVAFVPFENGKNGADNAKFFDQARSSAAFIATVGTQINLSKLAVFGQGSWTPQNSTFLLSNGDGFIVQAGIRINIAPAFDREF